MKLRTVLAGALVALAPSLGWAQVQPGLPGANTVYAGPSGGLPAQPGFRALVNGDMPSEAANTVKGNPTGAPAAPQDVTPIVARSSALLNVESSTSVGDANYTILPTDRVIVDFAILSAPRTFTLPALSSVNPGHRLWIMATSPSPANTLTVQRQGTDNIIIQGNNVVTSIVSTKGWFWAEFTAAGAWFLTSPQTDWTNANLAVEAANSIKCNPTGSSAQPQDCTLAQVNSFGVAALSIADQTLTGGANVTALNLGSVSSGTTTIDCGARPLQVLTNNGAFTLAAPANDGSCILLVRNGATAGAITFSSFSVGSSTGDALTTTNSAAFSISIWRINGTAGYRVAAHQ